MKVFKYFTAVFGISIMYAFVIKDVNNIDKASWLIGTWENKTQRGSIYETWMRVNDHELSGKSYIIQERDTVVFENIRLIEEEKGLYYIPVVKNQNEGLPVRFTAKIINENQLVFENREHDFPKVITYTRIGKDSLVAEISGIINGEERKKVFPMKRIE